MKEKEAPPFCVIVPAYHERGRIGSTVRDILKQCPNVVVVDDGSADGTAEEAEAAGAVVLRHEHNQGKGVALNTGFDYARKHAYECVITMDGDGQHAPEDIPAFVTEYGRGSCQAIVGNRMDNPRNMPLVRRLTNRFMSWLLSRQIGQRVPDTQSGYRLYRCAVLPSEPIKSERFAAESEILLYLGERGVRIGAVPIQVIYRDEKSKINPIVDTVRFFKMLRDQGRLRNDDGTKRDRRE